MEVTECQLQVCPYPNQVLCSAIKEEIDPKTGAHGLFNTYKDV